MNKTVKELLKGKSGDYIFPFFWQHGEDEEKIRKMMDVIDKANCKSVCIESRPHPDFCGDKWWMDMDVILDEARKRNMKVWILDDSHFPTGFANGKVKDAPCCQRAIWRDDPMGARWADRGKCVHRDCARRKIQQGYQWQGLRHQHPRSTIQSIGVFAAGF